MIKITHTQREREREREMEGFLFMPDTSGSYNHGATSQESGMIETDDISPRHGEHMNYLDSNPAPTGPPQSSLLTARWESCLAQFVKQDATIAFYDWKSH